MRYNDYQQPIGDALPDYRAGETPSIDCLQGRYCRLEKLDAKRHGDDLYEVYGPEAPEQSFTYLSLNPVADRAELETLLKRMEESTDPYYLAVIDQDGRAVGTLALMRINPAHRVIEVGSVTYGERLKRTRAATEVQYLLAQYVFETLHYRRYEWKCDALNEPSRRAAERLGFTYEGTFRQAVVYKGRNRDTAWYSMLDTEWEQRKHRLLQWLDPKNFDAHGQQRTSLREIAV